jgi:hypothetical protein
VFSQELCTSWGQSEKVGELNVAINESSGLSSSARFPQWLYHTNDSWNTGPKFFVSNLQGKETREIMLKLDPSLSASIDVEDMDVAACEEDRCIFLADIGDNRSKRSEIHILVVQEDELWEHPVSPRVLNVRYPDRPHDAEAFAVHPNGDMYILTKEVSPLKTPPSRLYRLPKKAWLQEAESYTLEFVTSIDVRSLSGSSLDLLSHIVTGMDSSSDGKRLLVLTYGEVFELLIDLSTLSNDSVFPTDTPYRKIEVITLLQQESISYLSQDYGFIYAAEAKVGTSPIMQMVCKDSSY